MIAKEYKRRLKKACIELGTYNNNLELTLNLLCELLERKDKLDKHFNELVDSLFINDDNKLVKNELLDTLIYYDRNILYYLIELGLTPLSYEKFKGNIQEDKIYKDNIDKLIEEVIEE